MKKILIIIPVVCILFELILFISLLKPVFTYRNRPFTPSYLRHSPTPEIQNIVTVYDKTYTYSMLHVPQIKNLILISNFSEKLASSILIEQNKCVAAVNGGYYDEQYQPLGLFISEGIQTGNVIQSRLLDGYLWIHNNIPYISLKQPAGNSKIAIQSGPILFYEKKPAAIAIRNDENARRVIAGITESSKLLFLVINNPQSVYFGPLLGQMPYILLKINDTLSDKIVTAINLDGGSASAFMTSATKLTELTTVGSILCLKE